MKIEWLGMSCFKIQTKNDADETTIVIEPYDPKACGKRLPRALNADILLKSPNNTIELRGNPFLINTEGEFEKSKIFVHSFGYYKKKEEKITNKTLLYRIEAEDMSVVHLGGLDRTLDNGMLENLKDVDVLMVPIGGGMALDRKKAQEVISQIEPRIVIPMNYKIPKLNTSTAKSLEGREKFVKELGANGAKPRLKITRKNLPEDKMEIHVLDPI